MEKPEKIFHILVPIRHPVGGIRTYLKYTYRHLDRNCYKFTLVAPNKSFLEQLKKDLADLSVQVVCSGREDSTFWMFLALLKGLYRNKYDVIHSQGFTAGIIAVLANLLLNIPHIMTSHDILREELFHSNFLFLQKRIIEILFKRITLIQSVSYDAQNNLLAHLPGLNKNPKRFVVIENGIDIDEFKSQERSERNKAIIRKRNDEFVIGFIGRFMPQKGFLYLIEVVRCLSKSLRADQKFQVVCVGGFGGFIREYKKVLEQSRLMGFFEFVDFQESVNSVMREIDILAMPSLWEAYGLVAVEALICGTPLVAFNCIGLREVLDNTPARIVPVKDSEAMAHEIISMLNDYEYTKRSFEDFIPEARKRFDVRNTAKKLDEVFLRLIKGI
jgi:glycosyltransferase involved in cell wall biosynthesis